jgi:hypothetical protein
MRSLGGGKLLKSEAQNTSDPSPRLLCSLSSPLTGIITPFSKNQTQLHTCVVKIVKIIRGVVVRQLFVVRLSTINPNGPGSSTLFFWHLIHLFTSDGGAFFNCSFCNRNERERVKSSSMNRRHPAASAQSATLRRNAQTREVVNDDQNPLWKAKFFLILLGTDALISVVFASPWFPR